jgi:hypothetical protein
MNYGEYTLTFTELEGHETLIFINYILFISVFIW